MGPRPRGPRAPMRPVAVGERRGRFGPSVAAPTANGLAQEARSVISGVIQPLTFH